MTDRTTKAILIVIALGIWANFALRIADPPQVAAQDFSTMERLLRSIESDVDDIEDGTCTNKAICR